MSQREIINLRAWYLKSFERMNNKSFLDHHEQGHNDQVGQKGDKANRQNPLGRQIESPAVKRQGHEYSTRFCLSRCRSGPERRSGPDQMLIASNLNKKSDTKRCFNAGHTLATHRAPYRDWPPRSRGHKATSVPPTRLTACLHRKVPG